MSGGESSLALGANTDLTELGTRLHTWLLGQIPGVLEVEIGDLTAPKGTGGSNVTLLGSLTWKDERGAHAEQVVIRLSVNAESSGSVATADNAAQRQILSVLHDGSSVPVPEVLWYSDDSQPLGGPFWVMRRVEGVVPSDWPPYNTAGFLHDAPVTKRRRLWLSAVSTMAAINRTAHLERFDLLGSPADALERQLRWWESLAESSTLPGGPIAEVTRLGEHLRKTIPQDGAAGLSWGDARLGNMIFDDFQVEAVLDWEMASLGGGELDLAWWLILDWWDGEGRGYARLEGLGDRAETISLWESLTGRQARNLPWHDAFAAYRLAVVVQAWAYRMDSEKARRYAFDNPVITLIRTML